MKVEIKEVMPTYASKQLIITFENYNEEQVFRQMFKGLGQIPTDHYTMDSKTAVTLWSVVDDILKSY